MKFIEHIPDFMDCGEPRIFEVSCKEDIRHLDFYKEKELLWKTLKFEDEYLMGSMDNKDWWVVGVIQSK
jgi:hypothetical protein